MVEDKIKRFTGIHDQSRKTREYLSNISNLTTTGLFDGQRDLNLFGRHFSASLDPQGVAMIEYVNAELPVVYMNCFPSGRGLLGHQLRSLTLDG